MTARRSSVDRVVSLFAIACLAFLVVGPFAAWVAHERASLPGNVHQERYRPGEEFRVTEAGSSAAIWALPGDVDRGAVRCTSNGEALELAPENTTEIDGTTAVLLLDKEFLSLERLSCSGGGIDQLAVSTRLAESSARTLTVGALVATPILFVLGIVLRRRGYRWPI